MPSAGNDNISSGGANDIVLGGYGSDNLDGGAGNDLLMGDNGVYDTRLPITQPFYPTFIDLTGDFADYINAGDGDDFLMGGSGMGDLCTLSFFF